MSGGNGLAETADHEQRVVDAEAQAEHGGEVLHQDGKMQALGEDAGDCESGGDGKLPDGQRNQGGDDASEGEQQEGEGCGNNEAFTTADVIGAGFADVKVEGVSPVSSSLAAG